MSNSMIRNINIKNFRGIESLEIDDFKKINIFVGPNNSGKTTIIEALYSLLGISSPKMSSIFLDSFLFRNADVDNKIKLSSTIDEKRSLIIEPIFSSESAIDFDGQLGVGYNKGIGDIKGLIYKFHRNDLSYESIIQVSKNETGRLVVDTKADDIYKYNDNSAFLCKETLYVNVKQAFNNILMLGKKEDLIEKLNLIGPKIQDIFFADDNELYICVKSVNMPIGLMGSVYVVVLTFLSHILSPGIKTLFIDEIENGLHHETMSVVLNTILSCTRSDNMQIFITTHSYEFIEDLLSITEFTKDKDLVNLFLIKKIKNDTEHKCYTYNSKSLRSHIDNRIEFRGNIYYR